MHTESFQKLIKMNEERRIGSNFFLSLTSGTFISIGEKKEREVQMKIGILES